MDKAELLSEFKNRVDEFERYQSFIQKARSQATKFAPAVVEKVIKDNTAKSLKVVEEIIPLITDMEEVITGLGSERQKTLDGRQSSQFALEELELRLAIGEMDEADFKSGSQDLRSTLGGIDGTVAVLDEELLRFRGVMERWNDLGQKAGVLSAREAPRGVDSDRARGSGDNSSPGRKRTEPILVEDDNEPVRVAVLVPDEPEDLELSAFDEDRAPVPVPSVSSGRGMAKAKLTEDVSAVFAESDDEDVEVENSKPPHQRPIDVGELDMLGDDDGLEVDSVPGDEPAATEEARRAVLLYQEGTAEEQIYPFNGEEMTLGRGRDNDIQVKNDSKVSRYHCKLYRRGPNFYIDDNKSANGTLVNGELITERRLFGGEEIIIGETFFRFRIMD
jgi:hypothetical protein